MLCSAFAKEGFFPGDRARNDIHLRIYRKANAFTHGDRSNSQHIVWESELGALLRMLQRELGLGTHHGNMEQESAYGDPVKAY